MRNTIPTVLLLSILLLISTQASNAQQITETLNDSDTISINTSSESNPKNKKKKVYNTWFKTQDGRFARKLRLLEAKQAQATFVTKLPDIGYNYEGNSKFSIPYSEIEWIRFKKHNKGLNAMWKGFAFGFSTGLISGLISGDKTVRDCPVSYLFFPWLINSCPTRVIKAERLALQRGLTYGSFIGGMGLLSGAFSTKITIGNYESPKEILNRYAIYP